MSHASRGSSTSSPGARGSFSPRQPRIARAVARALAAWPGSLPRGVLVVAASWAPLLPLLAALAGDLIAVGSTPFVFGGLGTYSVMAGAMMLQALGSERLASTWNLWLLLGFLAVVLQHLALGVLVHRLVTRETLAASLRAGARAALRIAGFTLLAVWVLGLVQLAILAAALGLAGDGRPSDAALLLWPGMSVLVSLPASRYLVTLPVLVVERRGCRDALRRSALLTQPARLRVWLLLVAFLLLPTAAILGIMVTPVNVLPSPIWLGLAFGVLLATVRATLLAHLYRELRTAHDAPAPSEIAKVFR